MAGHRGSVERSGDTWWLRTSVEHVDPTGEITRRRPRVKLGSFRTAAAARLAADKWLARQSTESLIAGPTIQAIAYFERFLKHQVALWRPTSQRLYRTLIRRHLSPEFGGRKLSSIDAPAVREFIARCVAQGLKRNTISSIRAALLRILREARGDGYQVTTIDPRTVPLPKELEATAEPRFITEAELEQILRGSAPGLSALFALMGYAGLRIGEALGVRWSDVDFDNRTLRVRQSAVLGRLQLPKTRTSRADVPLMPALAKALQTYQAEWTKNPHDLLFASRTGSALRADNLRTRTLGPLLARLGLRPAGFHAFRHSLPRRLLEAGASIGATQRFMRHATAAETERYIHAQASDVIAALEASAQRLHSLRESAPTLSVQNAATCPELPKASPEVP